MVPHGAVLPGKAYSSQGDNDRAIADHTEAKSSIMNEDCKCKESDDDDDDDGVAYLFFIGLAIVSISVGHIWSAPIGWLVFGSVILFAAFCGICASAPEEERPAEYPRDPEWS